MQLLISNIQHIYMQYIHKYTYMHMHGTYAYMYIHMYSVLVGKA